MTTDTTLNLRALIYEEAAQGTPAAEIAGRLVDRLPDKRLWEILVELLRRYVADVLVEQPAPRPETAAAPFPQAEFSHATPPPAPVRATALPSPQPFTPAVSPRSEVRHAPRRQPAVGRRKHTEIRQAWQRALDVTYATSTGNKRLGDCTADDLFYIAQQHSSQAERLRRQATDLRRLAAVMGEQGASRLRDLPEDLLRESLVTS